MTEEFVIGIRKHRILGYIPFAYWIVRKNKNFYTSINFITSIDVQNHPEKFTSVQKQLIHTIELFSDKKLIRLFSKKKITAREFYDKLDQEKIENNIRPFIEKKIAICVNLLVSSDIRIFHKTQSDNIYDDDEIKICQNTARTIFNFKRTSAGSQYFLSIKQDEKIMTLTHTAGIVLTNEPCNLILNGKLHRFDDIDGKKLNPFFRKEFIEIPKRSELKYFESFILKSVQKYEVQNEGFRIDLLKPKKQAILSLEKDWNSEYSFILKFQYNSKTIAWNDKTKIYVSFKEEKGEYVFEKLIREQEWEQKYKDTLISSGLKVFSQGYFKFPTKSKNPETQHYELINWLNDNQQSLVESGFLIEQDFYQKKYFTEQIRLDLTVKNKNDWFDIYGVVFFGDIQVPFIHLRKHIISHNREFKLPNGEIAIIPEEWFAEYHDILKFGNENMESIQLSKHHFQLLENKVDRIDRKYLESLEQLRTKESSEIAQPENLQATLRTYQKQGFSWMTQLQENNFGACLADDMGLGKTLQTLSLLLDAKNKQKNKTTENSTITTQLSLFESETKPKVIKKQLPSLIVMPTSLIHNWQREIEKFTPQLRYLLYVKNERNKTLDFENYDIVLTSYGILRNDVEILNKKEYFYLILDESQYIKNPLSKTYKAATGLDAQHYVALTGTPIENSLTDLWAQMNFINHGLLGSLQFFKNEFIARIEKNANEDERIEWQQKLQMLIHPFILRRMKKEVAVDLPALSEQTIFCEMGMEQAAFYDEEKSKIRNALLENLEEKEKGKSSFIILRGLNRLRQIANHPKMLGEEIDSGKFDQIIQHIQNLVANKHKVLIFSSYVKHLNLFATYFESEEWKYSILTGKSSNREAIIDDFQSDKNNHLFLISLKAGGVGLNLTSADYVLIIDPWWNPAAENQAISRAHRIGQNKKVMVYRYISKQTIEEKIKKLQAQKTDLASVFVENSNPFKKLSIDQIKNLFE